MEIEFDAAKGRLNWAKHQIAFADAEPVFYDPRALTNDREITTEKGSELRHLTIGKDAFDRIIAVVWTKRGSKARLISVRAARDEEKAAYEAE